MTQYKIHEKVYYSFKGLYYACKEIQDYMRMHEDIRNIKVSEFATIKFSGCRRIGTTYAIARFCSEKQITSAMVIPNRQIADSVFRTFSHILRRNTIIITHDDIMRGNLRGGRFVYYRPQPIVKLEDASPHEAVPIKTIEVSHYVDQVIDAVLIDNTSMVDQEMKERIYEAFDSNFQFAMNEGRNFFWIFVG